MKLLNEKYMLGIDDEDAFGDVEGILTMPDDEHFENMASM